MGRDGSGGVTKGRGGDCACGSGVEEIRVFSWYLYAGIVGPL
jgi:hypothetical protein